MRKQQLQRQSFPLQDWEQHCPGQDGCERGQAGDPAAHEIQDDGRSQHGQEKVKRCGQQQVVIQLCSRAALEGSPAISAFTRVFDALWRSDAVEPCRVSRSGIREGFRAAAAEGAIGQHAPA